jgi:hypothetical protein
VKTGNCTTCLCLSQTFAKCVRLKNPRPMFVSSSKTQLPHAWVILPILRSCPTQHCLVPRECLRLTPLACPRPPNGACPRSSPLSVPEHHPMPV